MRLLLIASGTFFVAVGVLGVFVPVLPTTPFLLLAAICYARGSARLYDWLLTNRWFGEYITNYRAGRGIPLKQKALAIVLLWATLGYSVLCAGLLWWARLLLLVIAAGVTAHLVRLKTYKSEQINKPSGRNER